MPVPLKKELATFRACWNWTAHAGVLKGTFPGRGLRFPKEEEKEPFRTFAEIEAMAAADPARDEMWESLYLTRPEVEELLAHVRGHGTQPWVYPMVAFAAYTEARRSEMLRGLATDVDLGAVSSPSARRSGSRASAPRAPRRSRPDLPTSSGSGLPPGRRAPTSSARRSG